MNLSPYLKYLSRYQARLACSRLTLPILAGVGIGLITSLLFWFLSSKFKF